MSERAPYSRVYWSVVDDPKFVTVYDDDHHFATWVRMLMAADALWPASCPIPANARRASIKALSECGLIDVTGSRFRVHGLDAERGRRRDAARTGTKRDPDGRQTGPVAVPNEISDRGLSRATPRHTEPTRARPNTVDKDPLYREIRAAQVERYGNGMDDPMKVKP